MKNLYRRYKISQITNNGITSEEKEIIDFILDKIKDLTLFIDEYDYHNYMNSKGECLFQQDDRFDRLWVRYEDFWSVLEKKYSLDYGDIQSIIKSMIETIYKMRVGYPSHVLLIFLEQIEPVYKIRIGIL